MTIDDGRDTGPPNDGGPGTKSGATTTTTDQQADTADATARAERFRDHLSFVHQHYVCDGRIVAGQAHWAIGHGRDAKGKHNTWDEGHRFTYPGRRVVSLGGDGRAFDVVHGGSDAVPGRADWDGRHLSAIASDRAETPIALGSIMSSDDPVTVLSEDESWSLLSSVALGRLVTILRGQLDIFPVNFVTQRRTVLFRTAQGTKLYNAVMSDRVAFEADDHTVAEGWSVIIKGRAHLLSANADILEAEEAPLWSWPATLKPIYVRVIAVEITGRRFKFGPEPDRESTFA